MGAVKHNEELNEALRTLVPISALSDEKFAELMVSTRIEELAAGEAVFREGDIDPRAVYLLAGKVVMMSGKSSTDTVIGGTEASRYPLAHHIPRQLSAIAKTAVRCIRIDTQLLDTLLTSDKDRGDAYEVSEILEEDDNDWMTQMLQSESFANLPAENIQALFMHMEEVQFSAGDAVIKQGEAGDYYYMLRNGRAKVVVEVDGKKKIVADLKAGDSFGEEALISDAPRNASVIMQTNGALMRLAQNDFEELMKEPLIKWVTFDEAKAIVEDGGVWLDVRMPNEHSSGCIEGSHNLPLSLLRSRADKLKTSRKYVTYCDNGKRSSVASFLLSQRGFDSYVLAGGYAEKCAEPAKPDTDNKVVELKPGQQAEPKVIREVVKEIIEVEDEQARKAREEAERRAEEESSRRAQVEEELAMLKQAQVNAKEAAQKETEKRLKAEAAVEKLKKGQEEAFRKAEDEIKRRKEVEEDAQRIKAEAEVAQQKAEEEVNKLRVEREQAHEQAEQELAALREQREQAEKDAQEQAEAMKAQAEEARKQAEEQAEKLKQEAEVARQAAEADAKRIRDEAMAAQEKAEQHMADLEAQQQESREKAEIEAARLKAEAEEVREQARIKSEEMASRIVAEAEQAKFDAEQQAAELLAEAEAERLKAQAEHARFVSSQEDARLKAEQEVAKLKAEAEKARLRAEEEQQKMQQSEANRLDAEKEANRIKAEAEAARHKTEEELNQRQAESEAARLKAEEEAARVKAEAETARLKAEEEAARLAAEVEKARLDMQNESAESVAQLEAEAEAARLEAEEARRMREEAEALRLEAEQAAEKVREEADAARQQAVSDAERLIDEAEQARIQAEEEAGELREAAEQARLDAEKEAARLHDEANATRKQAEAEAQLLTEEAKDAQQRTDEMINKMKAEAEAARLKVEEEAARLKDEEAAARAKAEEEAARVRAEEEAARLETEQARRMREEAEALRLEAEQAAEKVREEADAARQQAIAEAEKLLDEAEQARIKAEEEAKHLKSAEASRVREEAEAVRLEAEQNAEKLRNEADAARQQAASEAEKLLGDAEQARTRAEEEARQLKQAAEQARLEAETEVARLHGEAQATREQAEEDARRLKQAAQQHAGDVISKLKAEAESQKVEDVADYGAATDFDTDDFDIGDIPLIEDESGEDSDLIVLGEDEQQKPVKDDIVEPPEDILDEHDEIERLVNEAVVGGVDSVFATGFTEAVVESEFLPAPRDNRMKLIAAAGTVAVVVIAVLVWVFVGGEDETRTPQVSEVPSVVVPDVAVSTPEPDAVAKPEPEPVPEPAPEPAAVKPPEKVVEPEVPPFKPEFFSDRLKSGGRGPQMAVIPQGSFRMGSPSTSTEFDERPAHDVKVNGFAMSRYEVTVADYTRYLQNTGRDGKSTVTGLKARQPVAKVSWDDAVKYARWLSAQTGKKYRLPTEAEWEYAALATGTDLYTWGDKLGKNNANCFDCGSKWDSTSSAAVGSFAANTFGLHDMLGNLMEWVQDCKNRSYRGAPRTARAWLRGDCSKRMARGGSYETPGGSLRIKRRRSLPTTTRLETMGIRLVRE